MIHPHLQYLGLSQRCLKAVGDSRRRRNTEMGNMKRVQNEVDGRCTKTSQNASGPCCAEHRPLLTGFNQSGTLVKVSEEARKDWLYQLPQYLAEL